jgi:hypothetical protein
MRLQEITVPTIAKCIRSTEHRTGRLSGRRAARGTGARRGAAWGGTVVLVGTGMLALSACGSGSPATSGTSTSSATSGASTLSPTVARQAAAGTLDVHLSVVNRTYQPVDVELCGKSIYAAYVSPTAESTCEKHTLGGMHRTVPLDGTWNTADQIRGDLVQGIIRFDPVGVSFEASNPFVGLPSFRLTSAAGSTVEALTAAHAGLLKYAGAEPFMNDPNNSEDDAPYFSLKEGDSEKHTVNDHTLLLERLPDSNWKEMRMTILPLGE